MFTHSRRRKRVTAGHAHPAAFCMLVVAVIACAYAALAMHLRGKAIADQEKQAGNIAFLLAQETDRSFQSLDLVLTSTIAMIRKQGVSDPNSLKAGFSGSEMHEMLAASVGGLPHVTNVSIVGADGKVINRSRGGLISGLDLSGRDYFIAQQAAGTREFPFVSRPTTNLATGVISVFVSRRISGPDGVFLGVVVGVFDPSSFESTYERLGFEDRVSTIMLHRQDGVLLSRFPHADALVGQSFNGTRSFDRLVASRADGIVHEISPIDGAKKIVSVVNTPHFPLAQLVTLSMPHIMAEWRKQATFLGGVALLLVGVISTAVLLAARHADQATRAETAMELAAERERSETALRKEHARLEVALGNMRQGLAMFDAEGLLIISNRQYADLYKLPHDLAKTGASIEDLVRFRETVGTARVDFDPFRSRDTDCSLAHELQDGRTISVVRQSLYGGGWVSTHEDITEQRRAEERIRHLAGHDPLTDLPNRLLFQESLKQRLSQMQPGQRFAVLYVDLDRFKPVNDAFGHEAGDIVLKEVAIRLARILRKGDMLARIGGDEFAVLFALRRGPSDAARLAQRLLRALHTAFQLPGDRLLTNLGASIGISLAPRDGTSPDRLIRSADLAMYHAKDAARGGFSFFNPKMDEKVRLRRKLEADLRRAVEQEEFLLHYQPQVDLRSGAVVGFEALLRWNDPERGLLNPSEFVEVAEELGIIVPIGEWVLREACAEAARLPSTTKMAVNLSAVQFNSPRLVEVVEKALASAGLPAHRLEIEVTESVLVREADQAVAVLHELRGMGISIAMDDFGTGYSSMSYLRLFPFDKLKIDKSFVMELEGSADCKAIVRAATSLARSLTMQATAEGIETEEQLRLVTAMGCTHGQGYWFGKPATAQEARRMMEVTATLAA